MSRQEFEDQLKQYLRQEPFQPFEVELRDGRIIEVCEARLAFGGGGASFLTPSYDLVEFVCEDVRGFHPLLNEATR